MPPFAACKTMFSFQNSPSQPAKQCFHFKTARHNLRKPFSKSFGTFAALQNALSFSKHTFATRDSRCQNRLAMAAPLTRKKKAPRLRGCYSIILYITNRLSPSRGLLSHSRHRYKAIRPCNQASDCVQSLIQWHHSPSPSRIYNDTCPS